MTPRIEILSAKKLVGKHSKMSFANNRTAELWRSFMPYRKDIKNVISSDLYSLQVYESPSYFQNFNPQTEFEKWALIEVSEINSIPENMETFKLESGLYAIFAYKGLASDFAEMFQFIFNKWLPESEYTLDDRPHFELLGEKYKNNDPDSEEEIWIPIKLKA